VELSPAQHELRKLGYGGSDVGAIVCVNPWKSPSDVWLDKMGMAPAFESTQRSRNGHRFEPVARQWYMEEGRPGTVVRQPGTIFHPTIPWWLASPDGIVYASEDALMGGAEPERGMEIKTHTVHLRHLYGEPGTDEVPIWELHQCVWCMGATGLSEWDLVPLLDGEFTMYTVQRDLELEQLLYEEVLTFHERYVLTKTPPPADGSDGYAAELLRKHPRHTSEVIVPAGDDVVAAALELRDMRRGLEQACGRAAELEQIIKTAIGDDSGVSWHDADGTANKITWRAIADSLGMDWKGLAEEALAGLEMLATHVLINLPKLNGTAEERVLQDLISGLAIAGMRTRHDGKVIKKGSRRFVCPKGWGKGFPKDKD